MIISSDTDFGMILAAQRASSPPVVLTREVSTLPASDLAKVLLMNLETFAADLEAGAIVAIDLYRAVLDRVGARLTAAVGTRDHAIASLDALIGAAAADPDGFRLLCRQRPEER